MRAKLLLRAAAGAGVCLVSLIGACSLGLDRSRLDLPFEAGGSDVTVEVGPEADIPPGATTCVGEGQPCGKNGCYEGRCFSGQCNIELCPAQEHPCQFRTCTDGTTCSEPTPNKFVATTMTLGSAGLGCGNSLDACVAVVYPFAFVGPKTGDVAAYPIVDFSRPPPDAGAFSPAAVKLQNVDFTVTRVIASGDRVWFLGEVKLIGTVTQVPVAWINVPIDASLKTMTAVKGALTLPSQSSAIAGAFPGADKGLLVLLSDVKNTPPSRVTQLKVVDGGLNPATEFNSLPGYDGGASIVASSGDRLITARPMAGPPAALYDIDIIIRAGAANAVSLGVKDLTNAIAPQALYPSVTFASTPGGAVLAQGAVAQLEVDGGVASVVGVEGVSVSWFLQQADDTIIESKGLAKVLAYPEAGVPAPEPALIGPLAAIGENTAIALHLQNDASAVRVVVRDPVTKATTVPIASQTQLGLMPGAYVVRGARSPVTGKEYGYAFSHPTSDASGINLTVLQLGCGN